MYLSNVWTEWMIPMVWQVALLVGAICFLIRFPLRNQSARLKYAIWQLVPARLLLPPSLVLATGWAYWFLPPKPLEIPERDSISARAATPNRVNQSTSISEAGRPDKQLSDSLATSNTRVASAIQEINALRSGDEFSKTARIESAKIDWFSCLWLAVGSIHFVGAAFMLIRLLLAVFAAKKIRHRSFQASQKLLDLVEQCQELVRVPVNVGVACTPNKGSPMLIGILRPTILVPSGMDSFLSDDEVKAILVHELHHVRRWDPLVHLVERILLCVYWFHPAIWLAFHRSRLLRELACDEATVETLKGKQAEYGMGIVKIAEWVAIPSPALSVPFVGMKDQLSNRIQHILDPRTLGATRLTWRSIIIVLGLGLLLIPSAQRHVASVLQASPTIAIDNDALTEQIEDERFATLPEMKVKVVDEEGRPLSDVKLFANTMIMDGQNDDKWNNTYYTDQLGEATVRIPSKTASLRLWATRKDLAGIFISWETEKFRSSPQIDELPSELTLTLGKGTVIGGTVVDVENKPVRNAKVQVSLSSGGMKPDANSHSRLDSWLASEEGALVTDEDGNWKLNNAPAGDDVELKLTVASDEHLGTTSYKPISNFGITLAQLRQKTARIQLQNGLRLQGRVTDPEGKPIRDALVVWGNTPYWESGSQELPTNDQGEFALPAREAGAIRVTIVAKGWMPQTRVVELQGSGVRADFTLKPGRSLRLKFVDRTGKPVEDVLMQLSKWNGVEALYNTIHSSVKPTGIPRKSNSDGEFTWSWAPDDEITWVASKVIGDQRELVFSKRLNLVADDSLQEITIVPPCEIRADVVSSLDGTPVKNFSITPITFSSTLENSRGLEQGSWTKKITNNRIRYSLAPWGSDDNVKMVALRIDADGYRVFETKRFGLEDESTEETIRLEPCDPQIGRIKNFSEHQKVTVRLVRPRGGLLMNGFQDYWTDFEPSLPTTPAGEFSYPGQNSNYAIVVASENGYAEKYCTRDQQCGELELKPWASVEGTVFQESKPVPNAQVSICPIRQLGGDNPHVQDQFWTTTDTNGHFSFKKVPPVPSVVSPFLSSWEDFPITSSQSLALDLKPGEARQLNLGGDGMQVTGQVRLKGGETSHIQFRYGMHYLVRTDAGQIAVPDHARVPSEFRACEQRDLMRKLVRGTGELKAMEFHHIKINPDGSFIVNGVRPGSYRLLFQVYEPPTGCLIDPVGLKYMEFKTSDYPVSHNTLNLGQIDIAINPLLKEGEPVPSFRWKSFDGKPVSLDDLRGKIVVLDFWASWCGPCLASMPEIARLQRELAKDSRFRFVSISVDSEMDVAKSVIQAKKMDWQQGFAGDLTVSPSGKTIGINSVPLFMMLDEDGNLMTRTPSLEKLMERIKEFQNRDR